MPHFIWIFEYKEQNKAGKKKNTAICFISVSLNVVIVRKALEVFKIAEIINCKGSWSIYEVKNNSLDNPSQNMLRPMSKANKAELLWKV